MPTNILEQDNILPLVVETHKYEKDRTSVFKMPIDPKNPASVKFDFIIHHCSGDEPLRDLLAFWQNIKKLIISLDMVTNAQVPAFFAIVNQLLHGAAIAPLPLKQRLIKPL